MIQDATTKSRSKSAIMTIRWLIWLRFTRKKDAWLEVGCGTGFLLKKFQEEGWDVFGVEPDKGLCDFVQHRQALRAVPTTLEERGDTGRFSRRGSYASRHRTFGRSARDDAVKYSAY